MFKVLEPGTGLQHVGISNEWRDKPEVPSEVFRTVLEKKKYFQNFIFIHSTFTIEQLKEHKKIKTLSKIGG